MKTKRNLLGLLMLATLSLAACGGNEQSVNNNGSTPANSETQNGGNTQVSENTGGNEQVSENTGGNEQVGEEVVISFASITDTSGVRLSDDLPGALTKIKGCMADNADSLVSVAATNAYFGTGDGGCHANEASIVKLGKSKEDGTLTLTFADTVQFTKVEVSCHDFYSLSDSFPTNSNTLSVNGSAAVLAPYNAEGTAGTLTFDITASNVIEFKASKRVYIWSITLS